MTPGWGVMMIAEPSAGNSGVHGDEVYQTAVWEFSPGFMEIIVLLAIALIVLGPERMPEVIRAAGKIMRELRAASNTVMRELTEGLDDETTTMRPARRTEPQREPTEPSSPAEKP